MNTNEIKKVEAEETTERNNVESGAIIETINGTVTNNFCTYVPATKKEKVDFYNAIQNPSYRLADMINKEITFNNIYVEEVLCTREEDGQEVQNICPRIVLIDTTTGISFTCVSFGVLSSLKRIMDIFGAPETWDEPLTVEVKQITVRENKCLSLTVK